MDEVPKKSKHSRIKTAASFIWICLPLVSFVFIKPEWEARLIAVTGSIVIGNILLFYYGFKPKFNFAAADGTTPVGRELWQRIVQWVSRGLTLGLACSMCYFWTMPMIKDCVGGLGQGNSYLLEIKGEIIENKFNWGMFFLCQELRISDHRKLDEDHFAPYFLSLAQQGKTYRLLVAPKSKMILDWWQE